MLDEAAIERLVEASAKAMYEEPIPGRNWKFSWEKDVSRPPSDVSSKTCARRPRRLIEAR